jgi:glycosyltransferase involved in cell wall biosynthesis
MSSHARCDTVTRQFVTAFNGARDYYEFPLALHEMGLLRSHISDFYCPDFLAAFSVIPSKIRHRHAAGLPSRRVTIDPRAAFRQLRFSAEGHLDPYFAIDRSLSSAAAKVAQKTDSHLFLHCQYAYWAFRALPDRKRFMYQYHPHPASVKEMLEYDYALHPEVQWSFENERDSQPLDRQRQEALQEWQMADGVVCASSFTKSTLVQQGCRADIIRVVPYGIFPNSNAGCGQVQDQKVCRFIFVGQGVQRKGIHHLLKAWKLAAIKNAELIVVARKLDPGLRRFLDEPSIKYYAGVSDEMLKSLYQTASIFVMPSMVEGFGLVYLEALAAGLHCIGTVNTGLPDLNLPTESVSIVPAGNIQSIVEALLAKAENFRRGEIDKARIRSPVEALTWDVRRAELRSVIAEMAAE